MVTIRKMTARDQDRLHALFAEKSDSLYETYYVEQLTEKRLLLVAYEQPEDAPMQLYGYVTLLWESPYTQFWRRNVPEIVDLNVIATQRQQGIGTQLIRACETHARERGYSRIGISVVQDDPDYAAARRLYPQLGYEPDGFGITAHDNELHLWKTL